MQHKHALTPAAYDLSHSSPQTHNTYHTLTRVLTLMLTLTHKSIQACLYSYSVTHTYLFTHVHSCTGTYNHTFSHQWANDSSIQSAFPCFQNLKAGWFSSPEDPIISMDYRLACLLKTFPYMYCNAKCNRLNSFLTHIATLIIECNPSPCTHYNLKSRLV